MFISTAIIYFLLSIPQTCVSIFKSYPYLLHIQKSYTIYQLHLDTHKEIYFQIIYMT